MSAEQKMSLKKTLEKSPHPQVVAVVIELGYVTPVMTALTVNF